MTLEEERNETGRGRRLVVICLEPRVGELDAAIGVWAAKTGMRTDVTIIVRDLPGIANNFASTGGIAVVKIPFPEKKPTLRSEMRCAGEILRQTRRGEHLVFSPHGEHAHVATLLAMFLSRLVTTLPIEHRTSGVPPRPSLTAWVFNTMRRALFRKSKCIVATSAEAAEGLERNGVAKERVETIELPRETLEAAGGAGEGTAPENSTLADTIARLDGMYSWGWD